MATQPECTADRRGPFDTGTIKSRRQNQKGFCKRTCETSLTPPRAHWQQFAMEASQPSKSGGTSQEDDSASVLSSLGVGWGLYQARLLILW